MYSQNREEEIIVQLFNAERQVGHFLDIGAYDGKTFSNTLRLAELGWSGVCVEPSPTVFPALLKLHGGNPKISLVNSAVSAANGFIDFYDCGGDAVSTTHAPHKDKWEKGFGSTYTKMTVYGVTFGDVFRKFGLNFDFINLDVEGVSADLFMLLPLQTLTQTRCLCVEHDGKMAEIQERAAQFGFGYVHHNGENLILYR
jgi:FkbM family methyltransferase